MVKFSIYLNRCVFVTNLNGQFLMEVRPGPSYVSPSEVRVVGSCCCQSLGVVAVDITGISLYKMFPFFLNVRIWRNSCITARQ